MVQSQFSLSWNSYKNSICSGFTSLQQNGELVDMTLAADGHYVKVHQVLLALASPYLKELITSAPCQHPVLYLNNVSYKNMSLILEYIYTGEVLVPVENITSFAETARGLHIKGLENLNNESLNILDGTRYTDGSMGHVSGLKRVSIPTSDGIGQVSMPAAAKKISVKQELVNRGNDFRPQPESPVDTSHDMHDYTDAADEPTHDDSVYNKQDKQVVANLPKDLKAAANLQYTMSIRGSLQVILNRYIYSLTSSTKKNGIRRWRCIEYRNNKCSAFLVTKENVVLNRANLHNHGFHDKKILTKINKKLVFSAIDDIKDYKEKEDKAMESDTAMDEGFGAINDFS